jgi:hypothetical protein
LRFSLISFTILAGSGVRFFGIVVGLKTVSRAECIVFVNVFICSSISSEVFAGVVRVSSRYFASILVPVGVFIFINLDEFRGGGGGGALKEEFRDKGFVVGCNGGAYERF